MTSDVSRIRLKPKEDRRLKSGHLWVYSNEINTQETPLTELAIGAEVVIEDAQGKPLGRGYANPHSLICGRLLTRDWRASFNQRFFTQRLRQALTLRESCFDEPYYRAVYGDSDGLSGLVVDRFGDYLVAQLNTAGMAALQEPLQAALQEVFKPKALLWRNDSPARKQEMLELETTVALGEWPTQLLVRENGLEFFVDASEGQKTGWFYDHRENRKALTPWVKKKRVLDVFSYVGGWGLQALAAGADHLVAVDASEFALRQLVDNAARQGVEERVTPLLGNAFDLLKGLAEAKEKFDVVVVDPPAFIKRRKDHRNGLQAYRKLNELALRLVAPGGILVSASCSMHLAEAELLDLVRGASRHGDRFVQLIKRGHQGPDHPVAPAIPETEYLKALFFRVLRSL